MYLTNTLGFVSLLSFLISLAFETVYILEYVQFYFAEESAAYLRQRRHPAASAASRHTHRTRCICRICRITCICSSHTMYTPQCIHRLCPPASASAFASAVPASIIPTTPKVSIRCLCRLPLPTVPQSSSQTTAVSRELYTVRGASNR